MLMSMPPTEPLDTERLSRLIELRLKETNRPEQAAAFVRLGILRVILDALSATVESTSEFNLAERLLRAGRTKKRPFGRARRYDAPHLVDKSALLTPIDSERHALVLDFDSMVNKLGELSVMLSKYPASGWAPDNEIARRFCTMWETDEQHEMFPSRQRVPLQGSLEKLKPVSELSEAYQNPDFSKNRLRPTHFLR
jgi:hypothetical protein